MVELGDMIYRLERVSTLLEILALLFTNILCSLLAFVFQPFLRFWSRTSFYIGESMVVVSTLLEILELNMGTANAEDVVKLVKVSTLLEILEETTGRFGHVQALEVSTLLEILAHAVT